MQMNDSTQKQFLIHVTTDEFRAIVKDSLKEILSENSINGNASVNDQEFMNVTQASEFLNLAVNTLYEKTSKRIIPHLKKGNRLIFKRSELTEWIETGKVSTLEEMAKNYVRYRKI